MCGAAGVFMQGLGALSSANAASASAQSQKIQLAGNAELSEINARLSEQVAQTALLQGQREEQKSRIATANLKGAQRASMAANGIDLGEGSAVNVLDTTDYMGEIDADTIKRNAISQAWGYRTQATNYQAQAGFSKASSSAISPSNAFTTSLLGGAGQVASSWYQYNKLGGDTPQPKKVG